MSQPEVTIDQGTLRGSTDKDIRGNSFFKFQGIPYAKPPIGELRFKPPVPAGKWIGVFDATKESDVCYAPDPLRSFQISGSENCLALNVYTKTLPKSSTDLRPVLVWVHGGGFLYGSGSEDLYGPHFLLTEDVVLVTFNYRLGLFGFVSFDDPTLGIPGNAGMKDQVLALKWVQANIHKFGGNSNNVTIFGESAGGVSVHLLVLSPMTKGLFHRAIAQSGCALNPLVLGVKGSKHIAKVLGIEGVDDKTVYETLMKKSKEEILEIQIQLNDKLVPREQRPVSVVIEHNSKEPFLDDDPLNIIKSGRFNQVPFMMGYTSSEGLCFEIFKNPKEQNLPEQLYENCVPWFFGYEGGSTEAKNVAHKIKKFYGEFKNGQIDLLTDCHFLFGMYTALVTQLKTAKSPIFLYKMTVETNLNFFKKLINTDVPGVSHCDDIGYLFTHFATPKIQPGSIEDVSLTRFVKLWTNFAKFGNPTPKKSELNVTWNPVSGTNLDYLEIGENLTLKSNPDSERINFWKSLFLESPAGKSSN